MKLFKVLYKDSNSTTGFIRAENSDDVRNSIENNDPKLEWEARITGNSVKTIDTIIELTESVVFGAE